MRSIHNDSLRVLLNSFLKRSLDTAHNAAGEKSIAINLMAVAGKG